MISNQQQPSITTSWIKLRRGEVTGPNRDLHSACTVVQ
jgi:hypothetical protein